MFSSVRTQDRTTPTTKRSTATRVSNAITAARAAAGATAPAHNQGRGLANVGRLQSTSDRLNKQLIRLQLDVKRSFSKLVAGATSGSGSRADRKNAPNRKLELASSGGSLAPCGSGGPRRRENERQSGLDVRQASLRGARSCRETTRNNQATLCAALRGSLKRSQSEMRHGKAPLAKQQLPDCKSVTSAKEPAKRGRSKQQSIWDSFLAAAVVRQNRDQVNLGESAKQRQRRLIGSFELMQQQQQQQQQQIGMPPMALLFAFAIAIAAATVCSVPVTAAPLFASVVRPIWLQETLINLEPSAQLEDTFDERFELTPNDDLGEPTEFEQLDEKRGALSLQLQRPEQRPAPPELLSIERRRLERDRALEPPAWLRDRPIRKDPGGRSGDDDEPARFTRGRQGLQSGASGALYEDLLRHLLEEALESRALLDGLHDDLEARVQQRQRAATSQAVDPRQEETGDEQRLSGAASMKQQAATGQEQTTSNLEDDSTLVLAGDEVSDGAEVTLLEPSGSGGASRQALLSSRLRSVARPPLSLTPNRETPMSLGGNGESELRVESEESAGALGDSSQQIGQPEASSERFHVVEDIDALQDGESAVAPYLPALKAPTVADDKAASIEQRLQQQALAASVLQGARQFLGKQEALAEHQDELDQVGAQLTTGTGKLAEQQSEASDSALEQQSNVQRRSAAATKRAQVQPERTSLMLALVRLIRSGFFTRNQLIKYADKLRRYIERSIGLTRGSILGLFPMGAQQLLVELDASKLSAADRAQLDKLELQVRAPALLVLTWRPIDGEQQQQQQQNPIPILQAILSALYDDELDERRSQFTRQFETELRAERQQQQQQRTMDYDDDDELVALGSVPNWLQRRPLVSDLPSLGRREPLANQWPALRVRADERALWAPGARADAAWPQATPVAVDEAQALERAAGPLAALAAYYSAARANSAQVADLLGQQLGASASEPPASGGGEPLSAHLFERVTSGAGLVNALALVLALCASFALVRCAMRNQRGPFPSPQCAEQCKSSAWPNWASLAWQKHNKQGEQSESSHTGGQVFGGQAKQLEASGGPHKRRVSADSGLETKPASGHEPIGVATESCSPRRKRQQLDLLARRLFGLLDGKSQAADARQADRNPLELEQQSELATTANDSAKAPGALESGAKFRSSTSYIRSLIEALTRTTDANNQNSRTSEPQDDEPQVRAAPTRFDARDEQGQEIVLSQMDISAAHLILDYMERHLEDKERLRREWLELNAATATPTTTGGAAKATQLLLQRLSKVALCAENVAKNRNPQVVPFDWNRVRLGSGKQRNPFQQQQQPLSGQTEASQQRHSDYINASFIYDDDPRRPTHIIAQGPSEQTSGQFWQMIWEQEVSVIVMLTRLNESGKQMCHCYWPGLAAGQQQQQQQAGRSPPPAQLGSDAQQQQSSNGQRRGSVTSVFSVASVVSVASAASNASTALASPPAGGQSGPMVANGELGDNVLCFEVPLAPSANKGQKKEPARLLELEVHLVSEHVSSSDYLVRNMYLINKTSNESRTLTQFHYLAWPDARTPENVRNFLQFRRKVHKSFRAPESPVLVHCSDGAGRSGTYTLIDLIFERIKNGAKEIDLRATLEHLRDQRVGLCGTQSQFEFVLVALAEEIQIILNALPQ